MAAAVFLIVLISDFDDVGMGGGRSRTEHHIVFLFHEFAMEVLIVRMAHPGLDADEGSTACCGPESQEGEFMDMKAHFLIAFSAFQGEVV